MSDKNLAFFQTTTSFKMCVMNVCVGWKMSVFGDFQRVWLQRFPNSALPAAWEEDVRANLAKHKQKVNVLKEELEKEEFYVEYLERLLSDVEQHKRAADESTKNAADSPLISDPKVTIADNVVSKVNIYIDTWTSTG